ncbi:MAG: AMP-binding protein [Gammaproteobacteria bacterium]|nr:AMP-binding protein [Gammaproteobacteria bacterium]
MTSENGLTIVWQPSPSQLDDCRMTRFRRYVEQRHAVALPDYPALWQWSIDERASFWRALWDFCEVIASRPADVVLQAGDDMPGARWFVGARLNFAENLLRYRDAHTAILFRDESGQTVSLSYAELFLQASRMAAALHRRGIGPGDRVAAILPNMPEAVVGMLATAWVGATWSSCSPDFGAQGILDRFGQIEPALLICVDGYRFKGKVIDLREKLAEVRRGLPSTSRCIHVAWQHTGEIADSEEWREVMANDLPLPPFAQLPFDHPLYILFSSGTTGKPKCIVHGAGGTLLQHLKEHRLHTDIGRDDRLFYFTTCGWMMWNWLSTGPPLAPECFRFVYDAIQADGHLASISGGTDLLSC